MRSSILKMIALVMALGLVAAACGDDDSAQPTEPATQEQTEAPADEPMETGDIVSVAVDSGEFPTLVAAVEAAGLVETLQATAPSPCSPRPRTRSQICWPASRSAPTICWPTPSC